MSELQIQEVLKNASAVCFDVDSTLIREEGIDRLADACGVGSKVQHLTKVAMVGGMSYFESLHSRLNIIRPTYNQVAELRDEQLSNIDNVLTQGIKELVQLLHQKNKCVYVISGGFRQLIEPIVESIGISSKNIYCNELIFNEKGEYIGFDQEQYTCQDGGKKLVMDDIKKIHDIVVMIGDGITDYETCPPADAFIGFGGNIERQKVKEMSKWYIYDMQELIDVLEDSDEDTPFSGYIDKPRP